MAGKSHTAEKVLGALPTSLAVRTGDASETAAIHDDNYNDLRVTYRDEVANRGNDDNSKKQQNGRQYRQELEEMEDGVTKSSTAVVQTQPDGSTAVVTVKRIVAKRMHQIFSMNNMMSGPWATRVGKIRFKDPDHHEGPRVNAQSKLARTETNAAVMFCRMIGLNQLTTAIPSHFGLDVINCNTQLLSVFCSLLETVGGQISPSGRDLGRLTNHLCNLVDLRLQTEAARCGSRHPTTGEELTQAERALQAMVNRVASPSDVLAAYGTVNSCGFSTDQIMNALLTSLVGMFQHKLQKSANDDGKFLFCGFEQAGSHFVLNQVGNGDRTGEKLGTLVNHVHNVLCAQMTSAKPSLPDVEGALEDLCQRYISGVPALTTKTWTNPNDSDERGVVRWAVSKELLLQAKLDRICALCKGLEMLVAEIVASKGTAYISMDEESWIIPMEEWGDVAVNPVAHKRSTNLNFASAAYAILLPPKIRRTDAGAENHLLKRESADEIFRLAEHLGIVSVETFNTGKAWILADAEQSNGPASLKTEGMAVHEVSVKRGYISINIEVCKTHARHTNADHTTGLAKVAQAFLAVTLPPESFVPCEKTGKRQKIIMGMNTDLGSGTTTLVTVPEFDPRNYLDGVTTIDWLYRQTLEHEIGIIGPPLSSNVHVMPGTSSRVTYRYGDKLYVRLLYRHCAEHKMPIGWLRHFYDPNWPSHPGGAVEPACT